jgi:excisionase family DNA binding protein
VSKSLADKIEALGHALTADQLASLLSVSRITIFKHAAKGRIPSFRIGTCVRFDPAATFLRWRVKKLSAPSGEIGENMFTLNKASIESIYDNYVAMCERCDCKPI